MRAIRARLAALLAALVVAALAARGVDAATGPRAGETEALLAHTFEVLLLLGYAVLHPWLQKRWNPTGAFTGEAARRLESVADVHPPR
jgi:hypothetical protein